MSYSNQFIDILNSDKIRISNIKPSDWVEQNVVIDGKPFRYEYTPYTREIVDRFAPDNPARKVVVMGGSQIGKTVGIIMGGLLWMIKNAPGNAYLVVGTPTLIPKAVMKFDIMAKDAGIKPLIFSQTFRNKNQKSGDTNREKEYPGGYLFFSSSENHKDIAQVDLRYIILDDLDSMKGESESSGDLIKLYEKRTNSFETSYKELLVSTPLDKITSNIEPQFLNGDQRYYNIECPHCHEPIVLKFKVQIDEKEMGGLTWQLDNHNNLIDSSVGYVCQKCATFFKDNYKQKMLRSGIWIPTSIPIWEGYYSYHVSGLYAPAGNLSWLRIVRDYLECHPHGQERNEQQYKTFTNLIEGKTYEKISEAPKANDIMHNQRNYEIGTIPEKLSVKDGNGKIVLITCGSDLNGKMKGYNSEVNDARLDYEILAHSENGATYSICHGSIGTFQRGISEKTDRIKWTYEHNRPYNVWNEFEKILNQKFKTDTGRDMPIALTCLDTGAYATSGAYPFLDRTNCNVVGVKGNKELNYILVGLNARLVKKGLERSDLWILEVGLIKDKISERMRLNWSETDPQPPFFMNYPEAGKYICPIKSEYCQKSRVEYTGDSLYQLNNYFIHYEAESRKLVKDKKGETKFRWDKKDSGKENHMFDCRVYNVAAREILLMQLAEIYKVPKLTWEEYCIEMIKYYNNYNL